MTVLRAQAVTGTARDGRQSNVLLPLLLLTLTVTSFVVLHDIGSKDFMVSRKVPIMLQVKVKRYLE